MKETQHIEWKESWRDEYLKWISGFANAEGGVLVIGKNDAGKVIGVADAKKLLVDVPNKVQSVLGILVAVNLRKSARKEYIEIVVDPYPYPVSYKGEYHVRSGSTKQELKGAALDQFLLKRQGRHWDEVPVPHALAAELDTKILASFREQALKSNRLSATILNESDQGLLDKLHLMTGAHLKRAAVLLFHPDPERFITGAFVKIGYFENNVDLRYQDEIHGDLFTQVHQTIDVLKTKYLKAFIGYEGLQRVETYPVPEAALREAVLNAVVHKDYATSVHIQISVYPNKLMIWNPGQLPPDWTVEKLLAKHASLPFNPDVANAFFRTGLIESWGRGIERMVASCASAGLPEPTFECETTGLWTVFNFSSAYIEAAKLSGVAAPDLTQETTQEQPQTTQETTQEQILTLLKARPSITRRELAAKLNITADGVKYHLQKMSAAGVIRHVGPTKSGHWEILK
jgi:ATP-dependent DNA helicase RecG